MKLHKNKDLFYQTIRAAAQSLKIREEFIEKDYWITQVLSELSLSQYKNQIVFKGGTSLTKGHKLIKRFSEDIDLAVIHNISESNNQTKNLIRSVEKAITQSLETINTDLSSKGSRFRKTYYQYPSPYHDFSNNLILEINSFANPFPYSELYVSSFIYDFLVTAQKVELINEYDLLPICINVLDIEQTILEKLVSLFRTSFEENLLNNISRKVRHFYDLFYLVKSHEGQALIHSERFKALLKELWNHDKKIFSTPEGWQNYEYSASPLIQNFPHIWSKISKIYKTEMSALAFADIPKEDEIMKMIIDVFKYL